jgi:hypothetical protein
VLEGGAVEGIWNEPLAVKPARLWDTTRAVTIPFEKAVPPRRRTRSRTGW